MKSNIVYIFIFCISFFTLENITKTQATLEFEEKIINARGSMLSGQVYYSTTGHYNQGLKESYILRTKFKPFQTIQLPMSHKDIKYLRLDPLPNEGEIIIKNMTIKQGSWFNSKVQPIDFLQIRPKDLRRLEIIKKEANLLHLRATGNDPHMIVTNKINIVSPVTDYKKMIESALLSLTLLLFIMLIQKGVSVNYLKGTELVTVIILLTYSAYAVLYSNKDFVNWLLIGIPFLGLFIVYKQGLRNYFPSYLNMLFILFILGLIVYISDYVNAINQLNSYLSFLPYIILSMLISILFIQKRQFNLHFYKIILTTITLTFAIFASLLHYDIILIDTIMTFGYKMSMSSWAQKNYTFWYLFLMWSTISFFHVQTKNNTNLYWVILILGTSFIMIQSGYSDSAMLAFIVSTLIYISFSTINVPLKFMIYIPLLLGLYIFFTPWITPVFAQLYPGLGTRESIFIISNALIEEKLLFGYGYKTSAAIVLENYLSPEFLKHYNYLHIPGQNPHSIPLLIWLNFGAVGAFTFSFLVYFAMKKFIVLTYNHYNQAALLSLITSFVIITSFSWSGWWGVTFLTYSFFMGMIFLSLNIPKEASLKSKSSS